VARSGGIYLKQISRFRLSEFTLSEVEWAGNDNAGNAEKRKIAAVAALLRNDRRCLRSEFYVSEPLF